MVSEINSKILLCTKARVEEVDETYEPRSLCVNFLHSLTHQSLSKLVK